MHMFQIIQIVLREKRVQKELVNLTALGNHKHWTY